MVLRASSAHLAAGVFTRWTAGDEESKVPQGNPRCMKRELHKVELHGRFSDYTSEVFGAIRDLSHGGKLRHQRKNVRAPP